MKQQYIVVGSTGKEHRNWPVTDPNMAIVDTVNKLGRIEHLWRTVYLIAFLISTQSVPTVPRNLFPLALLSKEREGFFPCPTLDPYEYK